MRDMFTPTENRDHPEFLPAINMSELIDIFDEWYETGKIDEFWQGLGSDLDVNIWRDYDIVRSPLDGRNHADSEYENHIGLMRIAVYPVDEKGDTDTSVWLSIDAEDLFLNKLRFLLKQFYGTDWEFQWETEDDWVDLKIQFPSKRGE